MELVLIFDALEEDEKRNGSLVLSKKYSTARYENIRNEIIDFVTDDKTVLSYTIDETFDRSKSVERIVEQSVNQ